MTSVTGVSKFYIYNSGRFMDLAKEHLNPEVKTQSIEEVKNIASKQSKYSKNEHIKLNKLKRQQHLFKDKKYNEYQKRILQEEYDEMRAEYEAEYEAEMKAEYEAEYEAEHEAEMRAEYEASLKDL
jgi:hypothetical protein